MNIYRATIKTVRRDVYPTLILFPSCSRQKQDDCNGGLRPSLTSRWTIILRRETKRSILHLNFHSREPRADGLQRRRGRRGNIDETRQTHLQSLPFLQQNTVEKFPTALFLFISICRNTGGRKRITVSIKVVVLASNLRIIEWLVTTSGFLTQRSDVICWNLTKTGVFSLASMYNALAQPYIPIDNNLKI
jgi:3-oxoacyl-[acyl-carrier-protein] synthase III